MTLYTDDKYQELLRECYTKKIQDKKYLEKCNKVWNHLQDSLNILKEIKGKEYSKYEGAVLLHDIGKFLEDNDDHAYYGYLFLKEYLEAEEILLPIKYHECDIDWEELLEKDKEYINSNNKEIIKYTCSLVRDIDIISNMKLLNKDYPQEIISLNKELIELLRKGNIGQMELVRNDYDNIIYILCGLCLIKNKESFKYIKDNNIVDSLFNILFDRVNNKTEKYVLTTIKKLIKNKYNV